MANSVQMPPASPAYWQSPTVIQPPYVVPASLVSTGCCGTCLLPTPTPPGPPPVIPPLPPQHPSPPPYTPPPTPCMPAPCRPASNQCCSASSCCCRGGLHGMPAPQ